MLAGAKHESVRLIDSLVHLYQGSFVNGTREGPGTYVSASGETYEGDWKNDEPNGKGKKTWPNGDTYEGECLVVQNMKACS